MSWKRSYQPISTTPSGLQVLLIYSVIGCTPEICMAATRLQACFCVFRSHINAFSQYIFQRCKRWPSFTGLPLSSASHPPVAYRVSSVTRDILHCVFLKLQATWNFTKFHCLYMDLVKSKIQNESIGNVGWTVSLWVYWPVPCKEKKKKIGLTMKANCQQSSAIIYKFILFSAELHSYPNFWFSTCV